MGFSSLALICLCSGVAWAARTLHSDITREMQNLNESVNGSDATMKAAPIWKGWTEGTLSLRYGPNAPPRFVEGSYSGTNAFGGTMGTGLTKATVKDSRIKVKIQCEGRAVTITWNTRQSKKGSPREREDSAKYYTKEGLKILAGPISRQRFEVSQQIIKGPAYDYQHEQGTRSVNKYMSGQCNYKVSVLPTPGGVEDYDKEFVLGTGQFQKNEFPDAKYGAGSSNEKDLAMEFVQTCGGCADGNPQTPEMVDLCSCGKKGVLLMQLDYFATTTWCGAPQWKEECGPVQFPWQQEKTFYVAAEKMGLYLEQ